jgi:hypothetical protein
MPVPNDATKRHEAYPFARSVYWSTHWFLAGIRSGLMGQIPGLGPRRCIPIRQGLGLIRALKQF